MDSTASVERLWRGSAQRHGLDAARGAGRSARTTCGDILGGARPDIDVMTLAAVIEQFDAVGTADVRSTVVLTGACEPTQQLPDHDVPSAIVTSGTAAVAAAWISAVELGSPRCS